MSLTATKIMADSIQKRKRIYWKILAWCGGYWLVITAIAIVQRNAFTVALYDMGMALVLVTFYPAVFLTIFSGIKLVLLRRKQQKILEQEHQFHGRPN
jgi:hypothetical protein